MKIQRFLPALLLPSLAMLNTSKLNAIKPNIVYILCDDLGYGDVQCLNPLRGKIKTPNIDRFASQGMTFTDSHSGSSVSTPTRYGILTGRYAWRTKLQRGVLESFPEPLIAADRLTVPELLRQQGYHTACIGKWHLGFTIDGWDIEDQKKVPPLGSITQNGPLTRGFDEYFGYQHAKSLGSFFENNRVIQIVNPEDALPLLTLHAEEHIAERAKEKQPFFIYLALNAPHKPIVPSKDWQGKSGLGDYGDYVMETDWAVGQVLRALDKEGVTNNTLVIFTSDNGCSPKAGTKKLEALGHFASAQFRGYKSDIWDGGHRVPFFVRWPDQVKAGSTCTQLICHTDFMATCAEIFGVKLPDNAGEDSQSILPALIGKEIKPLREAVVHHSDYGNFAVRQGKWKLEFCSGSGGWGKPGDAEASLQGLPNVQLYDLSNDIGETRNVQEEHPDIVSKLTNILKKQIADGRSTPGLKQANDTEINITKINKIKNKKK